MNEVAREAVVSALLELARSGHVGDRADAGRCLASFAERPQARHALVELLLDAENSFVTVETAEALCRRNDEAALAAVATALASADVEHLQDIGDSLHRVFGVFATDLDAALRTCAEAAAGAEAHAGWTELTSMLAEINPVLRPD